ncbi:MAG: M23 family metallopeptidase [Candidatus Dormibacteraeota bacterium]|nr:M23 family metallopeptidase [Chloroflexota bacterium]MBV8529227.1 M23 family metallopeptidase [Candidatus Dormibacteraeota bacterium]
MVIRRRTTNPRQRRALVVAPVFGGIQAALLVTLLTGHAGAGAATAPAATPSAELAGTVLSALRAHSVTVPVGTGSRTWGSLVSIESALTSQQDSLTTDEQQIAAITPQLSGVENAKGFARRPGAMGVLQQTLRLDVADHQNQLSSFNKSLQQEYTFFVTAAQSPQAATELRSVAVHTPPDVANAVTTDLNLVQTQMQQETEIAAASGTNQLLPQLLSGSSLTFHAPVAGYVSQPFGPTAFSLEPPITYNGIFYPHFHTGLDIAAPMDTPLHAAASGVILLATSSVDVTGHLAGYGNYVVIGHSGGFMTLYGHMDRLLVSPGQHVNAGDVIGLLGSTGWSTGPHVHFEIRKNGMYTDPAPYIRNDLG